LILSANSRAVAWKSHSYPGCCKLRAFTTFDIANRPTVLYVSRSPRVPLGLLSAIAKAEIRKQRFQLGALVGKRAACSRRLLDHGGILLRHLIHVVDGAVDLVQPGRLLASCRCDRYDVVVDAIDQRLDLQ